MRFVAVFGAISLCASGCVSTGTGADTEAEPAEEEVGVNSQRCILVGPPPTGFVADELLPRLPPWVVPLVSEVRR